MPIKAAHTICLTRDRTRVVPEGDREAAYLLAREGQLVSDETALRYGIAEGRIAQAADPVPAPTPDLSTPRNNVAPVAESARRPGRPPKTV